MSQDIHKGWKQDIAASTATAEATYGADVTPVNADNYTTAKGWLKEGEWPDELATDKTEITGTEHGTDQEITESRVGGTLTFPKGQAHWMGFFGAAVLGGITSVKDAANDAYRHSLVPVVEGVNLPSWVMIHTIGGVQRSMTGCKGGSIKISGEENGYITAEMVYMGKGDRGETSESYPAKPTNAWVPFNKADIWLESGANITITAAGSRVQGAENISSATPEVLNQRVKSFEAMFNNNLEPISGAGGDGTLNNIEYGRRAVELKLTMRFKDKTEMDYYLNQDALALEINVKGAQIDTGLFFEGFILIIPRFKLKAPPLASGDPDSILEVELDADVQDDGTNAAYILDVFNETAAYLA